MLSSVEAESKEERRVAVVSDGEERRRLVGTSSRCRGARWRGTTFETTADMDTGRAKISREDSIASDDGGGAAMLA